MNIFRYKRKPGVTSNIFLVMIESSAAAGTGLTGLAYNTASLVGYYKRDTAASATAITLATATLGTFASGGFKEVDATNMPGVYEVHVPDAALASGAKSVMVVLKGAANMYPVTLFIDLDERLAPESYAADGAEPTESQAAYMLLSVIGEFAISGTTITCKKLDGSTTSMTFTLNSSTAPTSRTRAS